jgi:hypothetical protein
MDVKWHEIEYIAIVNMGEDVMGLRNNTGIIIIAIIRK